MKMKTNFILLILAASLVFAKQSMAEMYTLLIYETKVAVDSRFKNGKANDNYWNEFNHFAGQLQQAGVLRGGTAFKAGDQIKTVVLKDGKITVLKASFIP